jgi:membrane-associated phospholipid phosphatase
MIRKGAHGCQRRKISLYYTMVENDPPDRVPTGAAMHRYLRTVMLLLVLTSVHGAAFAFSCSDDSSSLGTTFVSDGSRALSAVGTILTNPLRWKGSDWLTFGGTCAVTYGLSFLDNSLRDGAIRSRSSTLTRAADAATLGGDGAIVIGASAGGYLVGAAVKDRWLRETSLMVGTTVVASAVVSSVLKAAVGRARPYTGAGNGTFRPFTFRDSYYSFPSGHSETAFALATVLSRRIGNTYASVLLFGAAGSVALSRVYRDEHWLSDVVFGGSIAYFVGNSVADLLEKEEGGADAGLRLVPRANGVAVAFVW